ncbi:MAG TPA: Jag N-terminal domain-containing protein, partial [Homoserinimonas sp.]|nr:Jag N-terminal domain-containing protein [Homoserinimonas sp.]
MTFQEFTGKNVEEAIRAAMREFNADLGDLDIEILSQGSRGILGVGGDEARILAAPKSAVAEAASLRVDEGRVHADAIEVPPGEPSLADTDTIGLPVGGVDEAAEAAEAAFGADAVVGADA